MRLLIVPAFAREIATVMQADFSPDTIENVFFLQILER